MKEKLTSEKNLSTENLRHEWITPKLELEPLRILPDGKILVTTEDTHSGAS